MADGANYPKLSNLITLDSIPDELEFLHNGLTSFFDKIYYKRYQVSNGYDGTTYYYIEIVSLKEIAVDFGGFKLKLNPDTTSPASPTVFPVSISYNWPIFRYIKNFDPSGFIESTTSLIEIFLEILGSSKEELIKNLFGTVIQSSDPVNDFVTMLTTNYGLSITIPPGSDLETSLGIILTAIDTGGEDLVTIILAEYITDVDPLKEDENFNKLLSRFIPGNPKEKLKELLIPKVSCAVELSLGLEVPRSVLTPMSLISGSELTNDAVYAVDDTLVSGEPIKCLLDFDIGKAYFSTTKGVGFAKELTLNMSHPRAQIGKTPFNIGFSQARYSTYTSETDTKESIITIQDVTIGFNVDTEGSGKDFELFGKNIVIDSGRGFSGTLGIDPGGTLSHTFGNGLYLELAVFELEFFQDAVVSSNITGIMRVPGFEVDGTLVDIQIELKFYSDGFEIIAQVPTATTVFDSPIAELKLQHVELGRRDTLWKFKFAGKLINNIDIPFANKFVPREFDIQNMSWVQGEGVDYTIGLKWDNGLDLTVSNEGPPSFAGFRKKFEISKKKEDGFFKLDSIDLVIKPEAPEGLSAALELYGAQFNLGKSISFTIDGLGLKTIFKESPTGNGMIGPFDASFEITGPKGIGVSIDAGAVKGTGYLYIDDSEYRGLVQLEISGKFTITAIAILNTKMPDGSKGNSFITIISITGLNIQLGMGFVLDGLGGILGIHRTMDTQFLRDGIREGTLDSLMFPQNVQENLSKIISDMKSVYPMKRDQFIFGPMARLFWGGVKSIVVADLALLIEFSDPTRLIVLGKAVIGIIVGNFDLILIQVGVLAELNFTEKKLMIDASIYNSTLVFFNLEGDMALRLYWGDEKAFLLTVGGFHPDYKPSENMKVNNVRRMKISLLNDNPRLTIEAYFAVTSNTVQFGSKVDFYFGIKGFSVKGGFGFDCLFQFNPFQFTVGVYAYLGVYKGSSELMGISLNGTLKGTTPWSINGSVKFKVLFIKVKGRVDKTWGDRKNTELPAVKVHELVTTAFEDDKNWTSFFPAQRYFLVGLNDNSKVAEDDLGNPALLMNPTSTLTVKQDVVPLGVKLNHYYNQKVDGSDTFSITNIELGSDTYADGQLTKTKTEFAPAQYFNYSDKDKLKKSSFETMVNGVSLTGSGNLSAQHVLDMPYNYDITLYDGKPEDDPEWLSFDKLTSALAHDFMAVDELVKGGMISNHPQSRSNRFLLEKVEGNVVNASDEFVIVNKNTFEAHDGDILNYSRADLSSANDLMNQVMIGDPDLEGELMVVQKYEMI